MTIKAGRQSSQRRERLFLLATVAIAVLTLANVLGFAKPHRANSHAVAAGDAIFHKQCIVCHNKQPGDTTPFGPPNLHGIFKSGTLTTAQATDIITNGKGQMPAWGKSKLLTPTDIKDVIAYLKTQ